MRTGRLLAALPLLALLACGGEEPLGIEDLGSLQVNNTTPHAVVRWNYRDCGTTNYSKEVSLARLPDGRIEPGNAATVEFPGDRCFDHRFTLENGVHADVLEVTVPILDVLSINVTMPSEPGTGAF